MTLHADCTSAMLFGDDAIDDDNGASQDSPAAERPSTQIGNEYVSK